MRWNFTWNAVSDKDVSVSVSGVNSQPLIKSVALRQGRVLLPFIFRFCINCIDGHSRVDEGVIIARCKINCFLSAIDLILFAASQPDIQHALDRFSAACKKAGMKITLHIRGIVSVQESKLVYVASKGQCTAAGGEVQVPWCGIHEWRKTEQGDWNTEWLSKSSSAWILSLCGHKTEAFKHRKAVRL